MEDSLNFILDREADEHLESSTHAFGMRDALLVRCRDAIDNLHLELEQERSSKKSAELRLEEAQERSQSLNKVNAELSETVERNTDLISQLEVELATLERRFKERELELQEECSAKLSELQGENEFLHNKIQEQDDYVFEIERELSKLSQSREKIQFEQNLIEEFELKHKELAEQYQQKLLLFDDMKDAYSSLEHELIKSKDELSFYQRENDDLRQEQVYLQEMLSRKQSQLDKFTKESMIRLQQAHSNHDKHSKLEQDLAYERNENDKLRESVKELTTQLEDIENNYKNLLQIEMQNRIKDKQEYIGLLKDSKSAFNERVFTLEQRITELEDENLVKTAESEKNNKRAPRKTKKSK